MNKILPLILVLITQLCSIFTSEAQQSNQQVQLFETQPANTTNRKRVPVKTVQDTVKRTTKELIQELPAEKGAVIKIVNTTRNLDIRVWAEAKVKIETTVTIDEKKAATITAEEIMEAGGITFKSFGNRVDIQMRNTFSGDNLTGLTRVVSNGQVQLGYPVVDVTESIYNSSGVNPSKYKASSAYPLQTTSQNASRWTVMGSQTRNMVIYIPEGSRLDIDNKNTSVFINNDIDDARFKMSRSNLDARNFKKLFITADYYNINISDAQDAELELENGSLTAGVLHSLDLDSKGSEIDYEGGTQLYLRSQNDHITIDEISKVDGRKLYGDLRIGKLLTELDIEGINADIKIRNIAATVEKVKVNDQYADLRLPIKHITNFEVNFKGDNSTVFTPFVKIVTLNLTAVKDGVKADGKNQKVLSAEPTTAEKDLTGALEEKDDHYLLSPVNRSGSRFTTLLGEKAPSQFKANGGDLSGKHTRFDITCNQCSVDFK